MVIDELASNESVSKELGARLREARLAFPLTQAQLAERAGISQKTVANLESGADVTIGSLLSVMRALTLLSRMDLLVPKPEIRPSQIASGKAKRQRVRPSKNPNPPRSWKWGDEE